MSTWSKRGKQVADDAAKKAEANRANTRAQQRAAEKAQQLAEAMRIAEEQRAAELAEE